MSRALNILVCCACAFALTGVSVADDNEKPRELVECQPAKDLVKFMSKLADTKPEYRDVVDFTIAGKFIINDGGSNPDRMFTRFEGRERELTIGADGVVDDIITLSGDNKESVLCVEDQARAGTLRVEGQNSFSVDFDIKFKNTSGTYSMAELDEGVGDGRALYKRLVPGPMRLMIPKLNHVMIIYEDTSTSLDMTAYKDGTVLGPVPSQIFGEAHVVSLEALEEIGADSIRVSGGVFTMEPTPSIKKMKKMGFGDNGDAVHADDARDEDAKGGNE